MTGLGEYRWEGYSLEEKQRWMREGQGAAAVGRGVEVLDALAAGSHRSAESLRGALAELGVDWSGAAADSARVSLTAMTGRMGRITDEASSGGTGLGRYGDSFAQVSRKIPAQGEVSAQLVATGDFAIVNGLQSDLRAGPVALRNAELAANAALRAHEQATRDALATFPDPPVAPVRAAGAEKAQPSAASIAPKPAGPAPTSAAGRSIQSRQPEPEIATARPTDVPAQAFRSSGGETPAATSFPPPPSGPTMAPPPRARAVRPAAPRTVQAADSPEPTGRADGRRNDGNNTTAAPPIAPLPPIPPPIAAGDSYRTASPRYGRLVDPDDAPFGRSAVPQGGAHPGGLLDGRARTDPTTAARTEIELPRKAPSIPGLAPPGSLDGPDPRGNSRVQGAPLPPPVDRPLPLLRQTREALPGDFGRWRGDRAGAARGSADEQNFDDNFHELRSDEFPPVHGLGEERGRS